MEFRELSIPGVYEIELETFEDERGSFRRTFCEQEFEQIGLDATVVQCSLSTNRHRHTLRGLHLQRSPHAEDKLVRCTRGALYDVVVDLRADSPTYRQWIGLELDATTQRQLWIPKGCAHGFLTLEDDTHVHYQMTAPFVAGAGTGYRFDDPAFGIHWPASPAVLSEKDREWPLLEATDDAERSSRTV